MNLLPLCTAKVWPTKSGSTVLARDHVLITFFEPALFCVSTFFTRASWTNGPFFTLLAIVGYPGLLRGLAALPPADDHPLRRLLLVARLHAFLLAPRADDVPSAARTTAVRVVDGVHHLAAHLRALPHPAALARLAPRLQLVLRIAHLADHGQAAVVHQPHLGARHAKGDVVALLRHHLRRHPRRAADLRALPDLELDAVHRRAERDLAQRQRVAEPHVGARAAGDHVADLEPLRVDDVALLPILVLHERDARRAIRIVLDLAHRGRLAEAVALEVDDPVLPLVPTPDATHRDVAVVVTPAALLDRLEQRLFRRGPRDLAEIGDRAEPAALGDWLELTNRHVRLALEDLDLVAFRELDDRPLPVRLAPDARPHPLRLAAMVRRPHPGHLDADP